jgi:hypothetical protein
MRVTAYVTDLMDRSRLSTAAGGDDSIDLTFVRTGARLQEAVASGDTDVVVVDLSRPDAVDAIEAVSGRVRVVGFGAHVDTDRLRAARAAGSETVLARSAFFSDPARWITG